MNCQEQIKELNKEEVINQQNELQNQQQRYSIYSNSNDSKDLQCQDNRQNINFNHCQQLGIKKLENQGIRNQKIKSRGEVDKQEEINKQNKTDKQYNKKEQTGKLEKDTKMKQMSQQRQDFQCYDYQIDSKYRFAAFYLIREDLNKMLQAFNGYVQFNLLNKCNAIKIFYFNQENQGQIIQQVDKLIQEIQIFQIGKREAEGGIQFSKKYIQQLTKQRIRIFKDRTQNYKSTNNYICGRLLSKKILCEKVIQIKNTSFSWLYLYKYLNTRSYKIILNKIFDTKQIHEFIYQKFKCKEIQIIQYRKQLPSAIFSNNNKNIFVLLTSFIDKKIIIHQIRHQIIDQLLTKFIQQHFFVFCFCFKLKKQWNYYRYLPKIDKVTWFFITERDPNMKIGYIYIIIKKDDLPIVKNTIIKQIQTLNLDIYGRRYFKHLLPAKPQLPIGPSRIREFAFPKYNPYSWVVKAKYNCEFDWIASFEA